MAIRYAGFPLKHEDPARSRRIGAELTTARRSRRLTHRPHTDAGRPHGGRPDNGETTTRSADAVLPCPLCCVGSEKARFDNRAGSDEIAPPPGRRRASGNGKAYRRGREIDSPEESDKVRRVAPERETRKRIQRGGCPFLENSTAC